MLTHLAREAYWQRALSFRINFKDKQQTEILFIFANDLGAVEEAVKIVHTRTQFSLYVFNYKE